MKRMFFAFERQTGIVSDYLRRMHGYVEPPPPPKKWYQKLIEWILALFRIKPKAKPIPKIANSIAEVSILFNEWRTKRWNMKRFIRGVRNKRNKRNKRYPFGDRVGRFEVRKWIGEIDGQLEFS